MKKAQLTILAMLTLAGSVALASPAWCGYTDSFHVDNAAPAGLTITSLYAKDDGVTVQKQGMQDFQVKDNHCPADGGHAVVTYSLADGSGQCQLRIHDGPLMNDPTVTEIACSGGVDYTGVTYDGFGTYRYTLHFQS